MGLTTSYENYAKTLSDSTFSFSNTPEEIRGGQGNVLLGKYFHDSSLGITITDTMFKLEYLAANLGVNLQNGGLSVYESSDSGETVGSGGVITLTNTPVAFTGSLLVWYKLPSATSWSVTTATQSGATWQITISGASQNDIYCIKYFYQNANAQSIVVQAQYVPKVLHLVIINDIYSGDASDIGGSTIVGRLITDIPSFQLNGSQDLSLTATTAAPIALSGSALAISDSASCETALYYGTMTQEIFNETWQSRVEALAIENADIEMSQSDTETLAVRAVFGASTASQRMPNSNFTFAIDSGSGVTVAPNTGVITANATGSAVISATLTGYNDIVAFATVTVS